MQLVPIVASLIVLNAVTATLFVIDKRRARQGAWRISESTLLGFAAIGGSLGAVWARRHFRHKTRKQPFAARLDLIAMVHVGLAAGLAFAIGR